ncbi:hypothetical protein [Erwinia phage vB_Ea277G]|nr:hypothetical protein [Erwinia phage vB_Ea277G]
MALDFEVNLNVTSDRQKYEQTLIMALDVYMSHIGTTPYANAMKTQQKMADDLNEILGQSREDAVRSSMRNLGKVMQELAMYMGIVGAMRFLLADVIIKHEHQAIETWLRLDSEELRGVGYELSYRVEEKLIHYKLAFAQSKLEIDTGAVPNPLFGR